MDLRALVAVLMFLMMGEGVWGFGESVISKELGIADIPPCGLQCLFVHIDKSGCGLDDVQCQCGNEGLAKSVSDCMLANCTLADTLDFAQVQKDMCNLSEASKSHLVFVTTCICYPIAVFFVLLRVFSKFITNRIRLDDWVIVSSLLLAAMPIALILKMTFIGFGEHLWNLKEGQLTHNLLYFYIAWSTYIIVMGMLKCSLVLFYLDIFPTRRVRVMGYLVLGLIIVNTLVIFFLTIFNCWPVNAFWDRDLKGRCLDINAIAFANSASSIAHDVILFIFPMFCIRNLKMEPYRKLAVGLMFAIGTFGCVASIIRLHSLFSFKATLDPTWDYVPVTIWTEIELACGYICVSLPSVRALMNKIFPGSIFASINRSRHTIDTATPKDPPANLLRKKSSKISHKKQDSFCMRLSGIGHRDLPDAAIQWPAGWSPRPWSGPQRPSSNGHLRLGSDHGTELSQSNMSHASLTHIKTCTSPVCMTPPPFPPPGYDLEKGFPGLPMFPSQPRFSSRSSSSSFSALPRFPSQARFSSRSSGSSFSALPHIGCLPDANYSGEELGEVHTAERRGRKKSVVRSKASSRR